MEREIKKIFMLLFVVVVFLVSLAVFSNRGNVGTFFNFTSDEGGSFGGAVLGEILDEVEVYDNSNISSDWGLDDVYSIVLGGDEIIADQGIEVKGSVVYIKDGGDYLISGVLYDGQIIVYSEDEQAVRLILNGVNISSTSDAPITILNAEETIITLADGTINYLSGSGEYFNSSVDADSTTAELFSKDDLFINGNGSLVVWSDNKNGIQGKDQIVIFGGNITVNSKKEAIKAKDYIVIEGGMFDLTSGEDGIRVTEDEDEERGYIVIRDGVFNIESFMDAVQAETYLIVSGGVFNILTNSTTSLVSSKGLKAGVYLGVFDGVFNIRSTDDALHSNNVTLIDGGEIYISSGDDAIHSDELLEINNGVVSVSRCVEGLEARNIYINGGEISIVASDDGINVADSSGETMNAISGAALYVNGGYLYVNAGGDGLDSNGDIYINGGEIYVDGPTNDGNGALDCNGELVVDGGYLVAVGSSGMAESPDSSSSQNSVMVIFTSTYSAGTEIVIEGEGGEEVLNFGSAKSFASVVFSGEGLETGETYFVYVDGELYDEFTISSSVTSVGSSGNMMGGQMGGMNGGTRMR